MSDSDDAGSGSHIAYDPDDSRYAGAAGVIRRERKYIQALRESRGLESGPGNGNGPEKLFGLALSGGGIRSATFCLGVMQALARGGRLRDLDYLSTEYRKNKRPLTITQR